MQLGPNRRFKNQEGITFHHLAKQVSCFHPRRDGRVRVGYGCMNETRMNSISTKILVVNVH